jgi:ribosomal protein L5
MGIKDHIVFSEIEGEKSPYTFSLGLNIVPKKKNRAEAVAAYRKLGVPFKK